MREKNFSPEFDSTQPGLENFKKNSKKIKKHHSRIIFIETGLR